ncbi:LOW QUALITY PROTEIN: protein ITPRID1 [Passerculus sandwichensis]
MSPMFQVERRTRIWKSIMSSPWATQPHSALLQGAEVEALESCCRHAGIAAGSGVCSHFKSLLEFSESPVMSRCKNLSFSHVLTLTDPPQSITEWLLFWEKDPVEILLNLGFGAEEPDVRAKIPPRFLSGVSVAKGFDIQAFLETQKKQMDVERPNLYGQLEVLSHVVSALSSLLTHVITQQTKAQDTGRGDTSLLDAAKLQSVITQLKWKRISQLLCLTHQQVPGNKCALAYPTSQCPPIIKEWASLHIAAEQPHHSPAHKIPAINRPRKESPFLVAHTLKKVADLTCMVHSFEIQEGALWHKLTPTPLVTGSAMRGEIEKGFHFQILRKQKVSVHIQVVKWTIAGIVEQQSSSDIQSPKPVGTQHITLNVQSYRENPWGARRSWNVAKSAWWLDFDPSRDVPPVCGDMGITQV